MPNIQMLKLSDIIHKFDVRTAIDQDRVLQFVAAYEQEIATGSIVIPPITVIELVDGRYAYVDGRHRGQARAFLNMADVAAIVAKYKDTVEIYTDALKSNWGGSKPPTREDISYTITRMIKDGISTKSIYEHLKFIPAGACRAYVASAKGNIEKRRIAGALESVADGVSVEESAANFNIKIETLREAIAGRKKRWGGGKTQETETINLTKSYISSTLKAANTGIAKRMDHVLRKVESGEIKASAAQSIIHAWSEHLRRTLIRIDDWRARIDSLSTTREELRTTGRDVKDA